MVSENGLVKKIMNYVKRDGDSEAGSGEKVVEGGKLPDHSMNIDGSAVGTDIVQSPQDAGDDPSLEDLVGGVDISGYNKIKILDTNVIGQNSAKILDEEYLTKRNKDEKTLLIVPYGVNHELNNGKNKESNADYRFNVRRFFRQAVNLPHEGNLIMPSEKKHIYIQTEDEFDHSREYTIDGRLSIDDSIRKLARQIKGAYENQGEGSKDLDLEVLTFDTTILFNSRMLDDTEANPPNDLIVKSSTELYSGWTMVTPSLTKEEKKEEVIRRNTKKLPKQETRVRNMIEDDSKSLDDVEAIAGKSLSINEFVFLHLDENNYEVIRKDSNDSIKTVKRMLGGEVDEANYGNFTEFINPARSITADISPNNIFQEAYFDLLFDEDIDLVMAHGPAGNGKTLLAMHYARLATESKVRDDAKERYGGKVPKSNVLVIRSLSEVQNEGVSSTGFLPGSERDKMKGPAGPVYDNTKLVFDDEKKLEQLMDSGKWDIKPIGYMRGRSLMDTVLILDEPQNFTTSSMKTALTRPGYNTRVILSGDPFQNDRGTGFFKNGYTDTIKGFTKAMKQDGIDYVGAVYLPKTANERSRVSQLSTRVFEDFLDGY